MRKIYLMVIGLVMMRSMLGFAQEGGKVIVVQEGSKVSFDYTLTVDGQVIDRSAKDKPLLYTQGQNQIIPGLEKQLAGLKAGDSKKVTVLAKEAYGEIDPQAFQEVNRELLPKDIQPEVGMPLQASGPDGRRITVRIKEVKKDSVIVDFNHPLAGKTLNFDVKIVSIE